MAKKKKNKVQRNMRLPVEYDRALCRIARNHKMTIVAAECFLIRLYELADDETIAKAIAGQLE